MAQPIRPTKRKRKEKIEIPIRTSKEHIEIPIRTIRSFVPGTAPRQPPISLLPADDADAFIVDKLITPLDDEVDETVQRKLCYLIGWPDLPAARVIIPCTRVHEYVSPRMIEDFESMLFLKEHEFNNAPKEAEPASSGRPPKKRRGRRPRARPMDEQPPTPELDEQEQHLVQANKALGPSLSTPQTARLQVLIREEKELDGSDESVSPRLSHEADEEEAARAGALPYTWSEDEKSSPLREIGDHLAEDEDEAGEEEDEDMDFSPLAKSATVAPEMLDLVPKISGGPNGHMATLQQTPQTKTVSPVPSTKPSSASNSRVSSLAPEQNATVAISIEDDATADESADEHIFEVLRLEGDKVVTQDDGTVVRWFKVRWKGNWSRESNPSWEPEENINEDVVKKYLKRKAARRKRDSKPPTPKTKKPRSTLRNWINKSNGSVAEVFDDELARDTPDGV